jgi:hypothetical protein
VCFTNFQIHIRAEQAWCDGVARGAPSDDRAACMAAADWRRCDPCCDPCPSGLVGDAGMDASYHGGVEPDEVVDTGLGEEGGAFRSSNRRWGVVIPTVGGVSGHGCWGSLPGWRSAWLALRLASWRRWWLCLLVIWAMRG